MAERLWEAAEMVVAAVKVSPADEVLDLACGTGNAALVAAGRGASVVVGVDFEPVLLEIARRRARAAGLEVQWQEADVLAPDTVSGEFSVVLSVFGVMYAPDQPTVVARIAEACAPGARVGLVAWTPGSFMPAMGAALGEYLLPPPPNGAPPSRWGDSSALGELLSSRMLALRESSEKTLRLSFEDRQQAVDFLVRTAGHLLQEKPRLERERRWTHLISTLHALVAERGVGEGRAFVLELEYLLAVADAPERSRCRAPTDRGGRPAGRTGRAPGKRPPDGLGLVPGRPQTTSGPPGGSAQFRPVDSYRGSRSSQR